MLEQVYRNLKPEHRMHLIIEPEGYIFQVSTRLHWVLYSRCPYLLENSAWASPGTLQADYPRFLAHRGPLLWVYALPQRSHGALH